MSTTKTKRGVEEYVDVLRDELINVYTKASAHSFSLDMTDSTRTIEKALKDFISNRTGWKIGEQPGSFTYLDTHTFFLEAILFSTKGLGFMPIETAKNIVRWELEELIQSSDDQAKTALISYAVNHVEKAGWEYPFIRRRV